MSLVDTMTGEVVEYLSTDERSMLVHAEATIERGLTSFIEVGEALSEVRDSRLYREQFGTFEAYCRERWGITDRRARQMIDAAVTVNSLPTGSMLPVNERQAAELRGLEPIEAAEVIERATETTGGKLTASAIRAARSPQTSAGEAAPSGTDAMVDPSPADDEPEGESDRDAINVPASDEGAPEASPARPPVVGIDGKTYARPAPKPSAFERTPQQQNSEEFAIRFAGQVVSLLSMQHDHMRQAAVAQWRAGHQSASPAQRDYVTPQNIRAIGNGLLALADEWEQQ